MANNVKVVKSLFLKRMNPLVSLVKSKVFVSPRFVCNIFLLRSVFFTSLFSRVRLVFSCVFTILIGFYLIKCPAHLRRDITLWWFILQVPLRFHCCLLHLFYLVLLFLGRMWLLVLWVICRSWSLFFFVSALLFKSFLFRM